ncbi:MAG: DUF4870 domain-containing protein [Candidatus Omnitrophica bacterium]|nr:DUF4870 domain-containing protein [Candidatus Omnitrophota bacterium]
MDAKDLGKTSLGMEANIAALLSYLFTFISGIIVYILEKENKFVRFHAMQSIVVFGSLFALSLMLQFVLIVLWPLVVILNITGIVLWIVLMVKAYKGEYFKLPFAGDIAQKSS